jgi:hypothetical protein
VIRPPRLITGDERPAAHAGPPHRTRRNHGQSVAVVPLLDPLKHGCPCRGRDLPARIRYGLRVARQRQKPRMVKGRGERISSGRGSGSVFLGDRQIASATEQLFQRDACQGRPMARCPSVPVRLFIQHSNIIEPLFFRIAVSSLCWLSYLCFLTHALQ